MSGRYSSASALRAALNDRLLERARALGRDPNQQYAEELHALTRLYESGESSRVRDLVDLVLLVEDGVPADSALVRRVQHVLAIRRTHAVPEELPPPPLGWAARYGALAAEVGLTVASVEEAHKIVSRHWQQARTAYLG